MGSPTAGQAGSPAFPQGQLSEIISLSLPIGLPGAEPGCSRDLRLQSAHAGGVTPAHA